MATEPSEQQPKQGRRKPTQKQLDALKATQFKPGESGNPGGRPKRKPITDALVKLLNEKDSKTRAFNLREVAKALVKEAKAGNVQAIRELIDRVEGKSTTVVHLSGDEGGPLQHEFDGKGLDELKAMAVAKMKRLGLLP